MTLKHGKFLISNESILTYLGLPKDSHIEFNNSDDGIEVYVISDENNDLLVNKTSNKSHLRRNHIYLNR